MMKGRKIQIIPSAELYSWKLLELAGKVGVIVEMVKRENNMGCWVKLTEPYHEEVEWFVPIKSIQLLTNNDGAANR